MTFPVRGELDIGNLAGDYYFLMVILLGMGEEFGDLQKAGRVDKRWRKTQSGKKENESEKPYGSRLLRSLPDAGQCAHDVDVLYVTGNKVQS